VAILDALGAAAYGKSEINRFMKSRDIVLRLAQEKAETMLNVDLLSIFTFNDTIVFALQSENDKPDIEEADAFFLLLRKFIVDSLQNGILFRGAIALGTFYADAATNTVMGEAVTDAASWYAKASWIGVHATPRSTIYLESLLEEEQKKRNYSMVDYSVPMKEGSAVRLKVVNWPKALFTATVPGELRSSPRATVMRWFGHQPVPIGSEEKCFNAIAFFDEIVKKQKLVPKLPKAPRGQSG